MPTASIFDDLAASRIPFTIEFYPDDEADLPPGEPPGFFVWLGNEFTEPSAAMDAPVQTWAEVERWLIETACRCFPDSAFARQRRSVTG